MSIPSPLFHRDKSHNISFPWFTDGWYWSPEANEALRCGAEIVEGWEYRELRHAHSVGYRKCTTNVDSGA